MSEREEPDEQIGPEDEQRAGELFHGAADLDTTGDFVARTVALHRAKRRRRTTTAFSLVAAAAVVAIVLPMLWPGGGQDGHDGIAAPSSDSVTFVFHRSGVEGLDVPDEFPANAVVPDLTALTDTRWGLAGVIGEPEGETVQRILAGEGMELVFYDSVRGQLMGLEVPDCSAGVSAQGEVRLDAAGSFADLGMGGRQPRCEGAGQPAIWTLGELTEQGWLHQWGDDTLLLSVRTPETEGCPREVRSAITDYAQYDSLAEALERGMAVQGRIETSRVQLNTTMGTTAETVFTMVITDGLGGRHSIGARVEFRVLGGMLDCVEYQVDRTPTLEYGEEYLVLLSDRDMDEPRPVLNIDQSFYRVAEDGEYQTMGDERFDLEVTRDDLVAAQSNGT